MRSVVSHGMLVGALAALSTAQNCPFLGPSYPPVTDRAAPAFVSAGAAFDKILADAFASGKFTANDTGYAVQVFSADSKTPIYSTYRNPTAPLQGNTTKPVTIGPDTVFRMYSLSKLITVYTVLAKLGEKYWDEPVSKYIPEFANMQGGNPVYDADWNQITLGSLASLMSGVGRDYAYNDFSQGKKDRVPGFRGLLDSEVPKCGLMPFRPCSRAESLQRVLTVFPFSSSFTSPNYSNMAFQLLAYAVENITGTPFPELIKSQLIQPLNLRNTFVTMPSSNQTSNAFILPGWDYDFGDEAPMGGYYTSVSDMSTIGSSILASTLLPPLTTRKWLKPVTHTASLYTSIGAPWEIMRRDIPISNSSRNTRVFDIYSKQGGGAGAPYITLLALSPDHKIGISIITTGGPGAATAFEWFKKEGVNYWAAAAEQAGRDAALQNYGGEYTLASGGFGGGGGGSSSNSSMLQIGLLPDEPGLFMSKFISNGTDIMVLAKELMGQSSKKGDVGMWMYPTPLVGRAFSGVELAFRGYFGFVGVKADSDCASWAEVDRLRYGGYPGDLAIFQSGGTRAGQVSGVLLPTFNERAFRKAGAPGGIFGRESGEHSGQVPRVRHKL